MLLGVPYTECSIVLLNITEHTVTKMYKHTTQHFTRFVIQFPYRLNESQSVIIHSKQGLIKPYWLRYWHNVCVWTRMMDMIKTWIPYSGTLRYLVRTMDTASLRMLSPKTNIYRTWSTFSAWKMASVATGSTAEISDPKAKLSTKVSWYTTSACGLQKKTITLLYTEYD